MTRIPASVREQVRQRANQRCEYCHVPEGFSFYSHQVDHIRAEKHRGSSELDNLAWACFDCNNAKGSDVASYDDQTDLLTPLFNPRAQLWNDHFEMDGSIIVGKTPIGRVTVFMLQMNRDEQIQTRRDLLETGIW